MGKLKKGIVCLVAVSLLATSLGMEAADTARADA